MKDRMLPLSERRLRIKELEVELSESDDRSTRRRLHGQIARLSLEAAQERVQAARARSEGVTRPQERNYRPATAQGPSCAFCGAPGDGPCPNDGPDWPHPPEARPEPGQVDTGGQAS